MKCYYHNDHDGRCAGAIVAESTFNYNPADYFEVDYMTDLPIETLKENETVYLVDYSFSKNSIFQLIKILSITKNVVWIDHHSSSIQLEKELKFENIDGIRQEGISGAALTYMYFNKCEFESVPYYIKLISDYDCWQYKFDPDTTFFKLGIETVPYNALDSVWLELSSSTDGEKLKYLVQLGSVIKNYIDKDNDAYRSQFAYESIIDGNKALVVNRKTNSWIFGKEYYKYPLVCVWAFNGSQYSYSIYSNDITIDCGEIAQKLGGGGHRGAAGFKSEKLLFKKICKERNNVCSKLKTMGLKIMKLFRE